MAHRLPLAAVPPQGVPFELFPGKSGFLSKSAVLAAPTLPSLLLVQRRANPYALLHKRKPTLQAALCS